MESKYRVVVLAGYSGRVAVRYFGSKQQVANYVKKVISHASELEIQNVRRLESRFGSAGPPNEYSSVDWA
jgi:ABC-type transport system involved in cytochrome bd biosynthesis fused ATPase/permease subunit